MATRAATKANTTWENEHCLVITWTGLLQGDDGEPVELPSFADRSVQLIGTFTTGTLIIEGSNEASPATYATLNDPQGNALSNTSEKIEGILEITRWIRPRVSGGNGSTSLTVH